jgi:hypothetical protein
VYYSSYSNELTPTETETKMKNFYFSPLNDSQTFNPLSDSQLQNASIETLKIEQAEAQHLLSETLKVAYDNQELYDVVAKIELYLEIIAQLL